LVCKPSAMGDTESVVVLLVHGVISMPHKCLRP
jgi:hypothetical protein